jgi:hypothetical protein
VIGKGQRCPFSTCVFDDPVQVISPANGGARRVRVPQRLTVLICLVGVAAQGLRKASGSSALSASRTC